MTNAHAEPVAPVSDGSRQHALEDRRDVNDVTATPAVPPPHTPTSSREPRRTGGLRAWAARRPVTAFLVLLFAIAYPVMSLPALAAHGVIPDGWMPRLPGVDTERIAAFLLVFVALLPVVLGVTWAVDGRAGVRTLTHRMVRWRVGPRWWLLVLTGLPLTTMAFALLLGDTLEPVDVLPFVSIQILGLLVNVALINIWEETAWAGFVQTRLERRHSLGAAALLTAVPFALIHMPLHFIGDFTVSSLTTALVSLLVVSVVVRLLLALVLRGTRGSILAVAVMHTMFNRSNNDEGLVAGLLDGQARGLAGLLAVVVLSIAVAVIIRRSLSRSNVLALEHAEAGSSTTARTATP